MIYYRFFSAIYHVKVKVVVIEVAVHISHNHNMRIRAVKIGVMKSEIVPLSNIVKAVMVKSGIRYHFCA